MSDLLRIDRDALYRECALQAGMVEQAGTPSDDDVDRVIGGAWVTCCLYIANGEVSELLSHERTSRQEIAEREKAERLAMFDEAVELPWTAG